MKLIKLTIIFCLITLSYSYGQTKNEQTILSKLNDAQEESVLDETTSYVIDEHERKIYYKEFKGKWLLIDFWSTGCIPCIKEFPALSDFYENHKDKINVIAVSVDNKFKRYKKSAKKYKIKLPHFFGGYTYANPIFNLNIRTYKGKDGSYSFRTMTPQYVLISPEGTIVEKNFPKPSSSAFKVRMHRLLNE